MPAHLMRRRILISLLAASVTAALAALVSKAIDAPHVWPGALGAFLSVFVLWMLFPEDVRR